MTRIILSLLLFSHPLFSCERTPPTDPSQLETWISNIAEPINRHRGIKIDSLAPDIQKKVSERATSFLSQYLNGRHYESACFERDERERQTIFFDTVQFWLNLQADATQCPDLLLAAEHVGMTHGHRLATQYFNFALQIIENKKCSLTAAVNFLKREGFFHHYLSVQVATACLSNLVLPSCNQITLEDKQLLIKNVIQYTNPSNPSQVKCYPKGELLELFKQLKEQLNAQTTT